MEGHSLPAVAGSVVAAKAREQPDATERVPPGRGRHTYGAVGQRPTALNAANYV
jgi:hypothetical protein